MNTSALGRQTGPSSAVPTCKSSNGSAPQRHVPRPTGSSSPSTGSGGGKCAAHSKAPQGKAQLNSPQGPPPHRGDAPEAVPRLLERLAHLATAERDLAGSPPLRTYVERSDGALPYVVATAEYREWFCRTYGVARDEVAKPLPRTSEPAAGDGKPADVNLQSRFKRSVAVQHQIAA